MDCTDISKDKQTLFIGGATLATGGPNSKAILTAVEFNETLRIIDEKVFSENVRECSALRRFKNSDCLAVGTYRELFVVKFENGQFRTLYNLGDIHSGINPIGFVNPSRSYQ